MKVLYLALTFLFSLLLTWLTRRYAIRKNILDIPNQRSSHQIPTPRGGGIAIVISFLGAVIIMALTGLMGPTLAYALMGGGLVIAAVGYADDVYQVKTSWRFVIHLLAALWAVYWLHGFPIVDLGTWKFTLNFWGDLLAVVGVIWAINFYNFMDGIDGLAGSEGLFIALAGSLALSMVHGPNCALLLLFFACAIAGFTIFNWPPAKIFMGDVGSGFIGYVFAVIAIHTANLHDIPIVFWLIIMAVFICDATFTVLYRALKGERWYAAHRDHAYQNLIAYGASHQRVTLAITLLNIFLILPIAIFALAHVTQAFWLMASLMTGLFIIWCSIKLFKMVAHETNPTIS
ncbi:MAG: glycosyltransferase family 4 protein [Pseudomonadota bacterium]